MTRLLALLLLLLAFFALQALHRQLSLAKERVRAPKSQPRTRVIYRTGPDFSHVIQEQERAARRARREAGTRPAEAPLSEAKDDGEAVTPADPNAGEQPRAKAGRSPSPGKSPDK